MKLLYKPFALLARLIAGRVGRSMFRSLWEKIDEAPPPAPGTGEASMVKVVGAQALQAGVMAGVTAAVDRLFASTFHHIVGAGPEKPKDESED
ncbi:MAG TPA: DUF4235 domain-containing protein [Solirubrobacteraceae bacterium]|nr:DUF4235 domain-containing protein [Solirubrobacteraceae bacterium]